MNNEETKVCYSCSRTIEVSKGVQWGRYFYCDECFKSLKCNVDSYHNPSIETSFKKSNDDTEDEKMFFGFELETTKDANRSFRNNEHVDDVLYIRKNFKELGLNFETDASIGNGMEIISQPMTYKYIKENQEKFKTIFEYLLSNGNTSHDSGKCGLHIHVSKNSLGNTDEEIQQTIEKLMLFVETYRNNVEIFSRRKHQEFNQYNCYTIPYHKATHRDIKNDDYYKSGKLLYEINKSDSIGHSSVINDHTSTGATIEFRMFRGTLKYETFIATLEFVNNLVHVCKENMVSRISWSKVINYGGDFIKDYVESRPIIDDNLYLRDYTKQIEDIISKENKTQKDIIDNYKKNLNSVEDALKDLLNENINFETDTNIVCDTLRFRREIYNVLSEILIDNSVETNTSLYEKLKSLGKDYSNTCRTNLDIFKSKLERYVCYNLTDETKTNVKKVIQVVKDMMNNTQTSAQVEC